MKSFLAPHPYYCLVHRASVTPLLPGEEAAHGPLCELPGGGAEGGGPRSGTRPHLLRLRQRGAQLPHATCTGDA